MIKEYIFHFKKLLYVVVFGSLVWFISFTLFPENQIIKISIGDMSPATFVAPKYIEIIDEDRTEANKEKIEIDNSKDGISIKDKIYYMKKKLYKEKDKKTTINNANKVELEGKKQYDMSNQILTSKFKEELNKKQQK